MRLAHPEAVNRENIMRLARPILIAGVLSTLGLGSAFLVGCAPAAGPMPGSGPGSPNEDPGYVFKQPTLTNIAPTAVSLGDTVTVFGMDFVDKQHGQLSLHLAGSFANTTTGDETRYEGDVPLTYVSPGKATFEFGPTVIFSPTGSDLGTFSGTFNAVSKLTVKTNSNQPGDVQTSDPQSLQMTALPSLLVEQIRSVDENCQMVTAGTTGGSNLAFGVRAIGMDPGTPSAPITFSFTFQTPTTTLAFAENKSWNWPITTTPGASVAPPDGSYTISFPVTNDNAAVIDPVHYEQVVTVNPPVQINQSTGTTSTVKLARFAAGPIADSKMDTLTMGLVAQATGPDGTTITRTINFPYFQTLSIAPSDQVDTIKEVEQLEQTNCSSGGLTGQQYMYSEGSSASRMRSITMSANTQATVNVMVSAWIASASASSTAIFGVDVNDSVTTESHTSFSTTINVLPSYVGASYRQAIREERTADAMQRNSCGVGTPVGQLVMQNWRWNYDINQGPNCDSVMPSKDALQPGPR
jgi:hypothetical protein